VRGRDAGGRAWRGWGGPAAAADTRGRTWRDGAGWPGCGGGGAAAETVRLAGLAGLRRNG